MELLNTLDLPFLGPTFASLLAAGQEELHFVKAGGSRLVICRAVLLEGLDGVGKSTLAAALAHRLNGRLICTPPKELLEFRSHFDSQPEDTRRAYYMLGNILVSRLLRTAASTDMLVMDRFWPSTFAYGTASLLQKTGCALTNAPTQLISWPLFLCRPPLVLILHLSEEARMQRLSMRKGVVTLEEEQLQCDRNFRALVMAMYRRVEGVRELDASAQVIQLVETVVSMMSL